MVVKGLSEGEESTPRPETSRGDRMAVRLRMQSLGPGGLLGILVLPLTCCMIFKKFLSIPQSSYM